MISTSGGVRSPSKQCRSEGVGGRISTVLGEAEYRCASDRGQGDNECRETWHQIYQGLNPFDNWAACIL